jgi:predicted transcriptional regulator
MTSYPVTSMGIATTMSTLTTAERARNMQVNRPRQFPVVKDDKLLGMVTRRHVVAAFESLLTSQTVEVAELEKQTA